MLSTNLKNHLLIAMPGLRDPNFERTVTYICQHDEEGAMGIVINRPTEIKLAEVFDQMEIENHHGAAQDKVYLGGPVEEQRGFVLHNGCDQWESTLPIDDTVSITTSRDILEAMARGDGPSKSLLALGYAGWSAGQLEQEMLDNAWLTGPAAPEILFELPAEQRWEAAARLLGVNLHLLSTESGHA